MRQLLLRRIHLKTTNYTNLSLITLCSLLLFSNTFADDNEHCSTEPPHTQSTFTGYLASSKLNLNDSPQIYQSHFELTNWQGDLVAMSPNISDDSTVGNSVLWRASEVDNPQRKFFSINPEINHTAQGIKLSWVNLNNLQKKQLKADDTDDLARKRLAWLLGSKRNEGEQLRKRAHYLGDIVGSNISILSDQKDYGHSVLKGDQGKRYPSFLSNKSKQQQAVFVGANDGALHAFNSINGAELFAYVPNTVLSKIATISKPNYGCKSLGCLPHEFLVDGQSTVADAYFDDSWHSILVGSLGLGGKGVYALEVSDVEHFNEKNVLWEISTHDAPINIEIYKNHLGFVNQEASIVRLNNGRWVVIVGNGSESAKHQAVLFVIDLQTGHLIKSLNTKVGSASQHNGLSTPISIDTNDDNSVDRIYAGDLLGNVWRFDLTNSDPAKWSIAFSGKPLFQACEDAACKKPQAITAKLQVGNHPEGGVMVYFGTHQSSSKQASSVNSFFAIRDNDSRVVSTKSLVEQQILQENSVGSSLEMRVSSNFDVNYKQKQGWMLKLKRTFSQAKGERVSTQALLREGQLLITSEIPLGESCAAHQSQWLMKLDALQGKRLKQISFDTNHDNKLTDDDNADYERKSTVVSGIHLQGSGVMAATPVILRSGKHSESLLTVMDDGTFKTIKTSATHSSGRVSWRQLR